LIIIFTFYCIVLFLLSAFKSTELFLPAIYQFEAWLGGDKLMHLKLSIVLSLLACSVAQRAKAWLKLSLFWRLFFAQIFLMLGLLLDESHQYLTHSRRFEWMDFSYGVIGLFIGLAIYCLILILKHGVGCGLRRGLRRQ
jgi:hypothetical protein